MSPVLIGTLLSAAFIIALILGMPIGACMGLFGTIGFALIMNPGAALNLITTDLFTQFASYNMSAVAMFCWMGYIAYRSGIGNKLFELANKLIGHFPGGLCMAAEGACAAFGAVCGSAPATVATIGSIAFPEMKKYGYADSLRTSCVAAGGGLGILIPPSMTAIVYGVATGVSIGRLFIAGITIGVLLMLLFIATIYVEVIFNPTLAPRGKKYTWKERFKSMGDGIWETAVIFLVSIGGLSIGWFTPTEGGAIGCFLMLFLVVIRKKLSWKDFLGSLRDTAEATGMIMLIMGCGTLFSRMITVSQITRAVSNWVTSLNASPNIVMIIILVVYLIAGCFISPVPMIMILVPVFFPIVTNIGFDPVWFGVISTITACMGMITPPVGSGCYIAQAIAPEVPLQVVFKGSMPFLLAIFVCIAIMMAFPQVVLFLPDLLS